MFNPQKPPSMQTAQSLSIPFPEFATFAALPQDDLPQEPLHSPILEENLLNICKSDENSLPLQPNFYQSSKVNNMAHEKATDFLVRDLLKSANITFDAEESRIIEIKQALNTASKRGTGKHGYPEFIAQSGEFIIVIEDKAENSKQAKYLNDSTLLMDNTAITDYAENGALHYAQHIITNTSFKKVFAFGCSGTTSATLKIRPIFVTPNGYQILKHVKDFTNFTETQINTYYETTVCQHKTVEQIELENILGKSKQLNEDLHVFGKLSNLEKPVAVSAILLALQNIDFTTEQLTGDETNTDGQKLFAAVERYMSKVQVQPDTKKSQVLDQFRFIQNRPNLSQFNEKLGKTPLRYFAEYLYSNVLTAFYHNTPEDILGRFYGEFMSYSGGDGQSLGIVLTPKHITQLFCELIDIKPTDRVLDPCCGTAGFLIAAMNAMLAQTGTNNKLKTEIKKNNLYGIELNEGMFSIATTNMILRGDGKSNLICADFLATNPEDLRKNNFTVGLMNPPYSLAKKKENAHMSEIHFIAHLLDSLAPGAKCVVIVPQSTMVGKNKPDQLQKEYILAHHTLEGVITLNPQTFFGVGTNPVIAVFTAHQPHPKNLYAKFINYKDDGFEVAPHIGLIPTNRAPERKKLLLECWKFNRPVTNDFMVRATVTPEDEWLHSFYYFNEEIPSDEEFEKTMADYLTFEFNMITHGREYLFEKGDEQ